MVDQADLLEEGSAFLEKQDSIYGKNKDTVESPTKPLASTVAPNLGKAVAQTNDSTISGANDSHWKIVPLTNLPSRGLFYPEGTEITVKAASVSEVRQWSTMDENDRLNIDDTLNFIIERCARIRTPGAKTWMTWRDISELDRLALIFIIHEITFTGNQNSLSVKFTCPGPCVDERPWSDMVRIYSPMLSFIDLPEDIMQFYRPEYKCFVIESAKLQETFYLYMPTIGAIEKLRARIANAKNDGVSIDKAFIKIAPYLIQDWQSFTQEAYYNLSRENFSWNINKFTFVTKFVDLLEQARRSMVSTKCPKCGNTVSTPLFSKSGFTIKDLFFISGGLNQLI